MASINGQDWEPFAGRNPTSGGSSDTETKEPMIMPTGPSSPVAVTRVTPVGYRPNTFRYRSPLIVSPMLPPSSRALFSATDRSRLAGSAQAAPSETVVPL